MKSKKTTRKTAKKLALPTEIQERFNAAVDRITDLAPEPIEFRSMTSIRERVANIQTLITLIAASASYDTSEGPMDAHEVLEAITDAAVKARDQVYWISRLPSSIANLPALTDDEYRDAGVNVSDNDTMADSIDEFCRARMREMLDGAR